jgi:4'-phosphopantetheinyl transferase
MGAPALLAASGARPRTELKHGEVHAWIMDLDSPAADSSQVLNAAERNRAASYLNPLDASRFAASRASLRHILGRYLGADPAALRFDADPGGRPVLAAQHREQTQDGLGLQFSLSRSGGVAVLAVSTGLVGADVEVVAPREGLADLAAARFGTAEAICVLRGACAGTPLRSFYRHWTVREAWLKAVGVGLAGLRDTEFECGPTPVVRFRGTAGTMPDLQLHLLDISPRHATAVVATGQVTTCQRVPPGPDSQ